jgi:hypothetical protein
MSHRIVPTLISVLLFASMVMVGSATLAGGEGEGEGRTETVMLPGGVPREMVYIEAGTFMMCRYPAVQRPAATAFRTAGATTAGSVSPGNCRLIISSTN